MNAVLGERLLGTAKRTEKVGRDDPLAAESAKNVLIGQADRRRCLGDAIAHAACTEVVEMLLQGEFHLESTRKSSVGVVFDRPHQNAFDLVGQTRIDLPRTRIFLKIKDQQRIILRIGTGQKMEHRRTEAVDVRTRFDLPAEKLRRSVTHRTDSGDALFLGLVDRTRNSEVDQHDTARVAVDHDV